MYVLCYLDQQNQPKSAAASNITRLRRFIKDRSISIWRMSEIDRNDHNTWINSSSTDAWISIGTSLPENIDYLLH